MQEFGTLRHPLSEILVTVARRRAQLYCRKSMVKLPKSAVIFPEERGYIAGRAQLSFCSVVSTHFDWNKIVPYSSSFAGRTHFAYVC
jgi:hypothetical protein